MLVKADPEHKVKYKYFQIPYNFQKPNGIGSVDKIKDSTTLQHCQPFHDNNLT